MSYRYYKPVVFINGKVQTKFKILLNNCLNLNITIKTFNLKIFTFVAFDSNV